jgi:short subunit dehydrogenase-like uncharacterized protein
MAGGTTPGDVVVFGATSFVGQILTRYLFETFGVGAALRWSIAGRSRPRLEALRASLGLRAAQLPITIADAANDRELAALCATARVVVSTVGPYALYGEPLVRACAESGTDYCDLTGEVQWIRRMISSYVSAAARSGARIVHCCGFDSIPSDLGVYHLQHLSRERFGVPCPRVSMRVRSVRGGLSGGTVASLLNVLTEAAANPALRKELADPYSLCPESHQPHVAQPQTSLAAFDRDHQAWTGPFVMAAVNMRIVHRTNALLGTPYGEDFRYDEAMLTGRGVGGRARAFALATGLAAFMAAGSLKPSRWLLERFVLPSPGEGPSPEAQRRGNFDLRFVGRTSDGRELRTQVTGDRDPGYGSTARMLGQAAVCLALDVPKEARRGGFWTPASAFGDRLIPRLQQHSGLAFTVLDD